MNKKMYLIIFISLITTTLISQSNPFILVKYNYSNLKLKEFSEVELRAKGTVSLTVFKRKDTTKSSVYIDDMGIGRFHNFSDDAIGKKVYKNLISEILIFRDMAIKEGRLTPFVVSEKLPVFNWVFMNKKKKIGNFSCKYAKVEFRGRTYFVWYTLEVPLIHGPWKFHGLPGLMVEVVSKDLNINFQLQSIKKIDSHVLIINKPSMGEKITFKKYVEYKNKAVDEFIKRMYTKLPRGAKIEINSVVDHNLEKTFN